jgi:hypothetical protein
MSIAAQNLSYFGNGPVAAGSTILASNGANQDTCYMGTATITGDGTTATAVVNYTNGTANGLGFTPSAVSVVRCGGNADANVIAWGKDNADNTCVVTFSIAPANLATVKVAIVVYK